MEKSIHILFKLSLNEFKAIKVAGGKKKTIIYDDFDDIYTISSNKPHPVALSFSCSANVMIMIIKISRFLFCANENKICDVSNYNLSIVSFMRVSYKC